METTTFVLENVKKPDLPHRLLNDLGYEGEEKRELLDKHFRHSEYLDLIIKVDQDLNIVDGKILEK